MLIGFVQAYAQLSVWLAWVGLITGFLILAMQSVLRLKTQEITLRNIHAEFGAVVRGIAGSVGLAAVGYAFFFYGDIGSPAPSPARTLAPLAGGLFLLSAAAALLCLTFAGIKRSARFLGVSQSQHSTDRKLLRGMAFLSAALGTYWVGGVLFGLSGTGTSKFIRALEVWRPVLEWLGLKSPF